MYVFPSLEEIAQQIRQNPKLIIADDYELSVQRTISTAGRFKGGAEVSRATDESGWIGLRLMHRKRPGRSTAFFTGPETISVLIETAFESAKHASPDPWFRFPLWKTPKAKPLKETTAKPFEGRAKSLYSDVETLCTSADLEFEEVHEHWQIETLLHRKSEKFHLTHAKQIQASHFALSGGGPETPIRLREDRATSALSDFRRPWLAHFLHRIPEMSDIELHEVSETCPLMLSPLAATELIKAIASWCGADVVQAGRSPLSTIDGREPASFSELINLVDDGTLAGGPQTVPFDMEGSLTQRTVLVDKGKIRGFLHDAYTATRENRLSTGNFVRLPHGRSPAIAPSNFYLEPTSVNAEQLVESVENGILIDAFDLFEPAPGGAMTEYLVDGSGWRIRHGVRERMVRRVRARIDLVELLGRALMVGNDLNFYGSYGSPSILFDNMPLGI